MIDPDEANEAYRAAHAIAGFQLADIAFGVLVGNGILPKPEAERLLKQAIAGNSRQFGDRLCSWLVFSGIEFAQRIVRTFPGVTPGGLSC